MITTEQQNKILDLVRELVPDGARGRNERRNSIFLGVIVALGTLDHELVPPAWLMLTLAGRGDEIFRTLPKAGATPSC